MPLQQEQALHNSAFTLSLLYLKPLNFVESETVLPGVSLAAVPGVPAVTAVPAVFEAVSAQVYHLPAHYR